MNNVLPAPNDKWAPAYWTQPKTAYTRGGDVIDFSELFLKAERGYRKNTPLIFTDWQQWLTNAILEETEQGLLRYRRCLIGLPRKNGKSLLGTSIALEHLVTGGTGVQVYSAARDRAQAKIVFGSARQQVLQNPYLLNELKVYKDVLENKKTGGIYRALSADAMSAQGLAPSLTVGDEIHAWETTKAQELYAALTEGSADREESMFVGITTAGGNKNSLLGNLYQHGVKVANGDIDDEFFGFFWWEAAQDADPTDEKSWFQANPNLAEGLMNIDDFRSSINMAGSINFAEFQRYRLNQWVKLDGETFISSYHWEQAVTDKHIPLGAEVVAGFDGSLTGDSTGIVIMDIRTGIFEVYKLWEDTGDAEWVVDREEVIDAVDKLFNDYNVKMLWADDSYYSQDVYKWSKKYQNRVQKIPQNISRILPLAQQFVQDIVSGEIHHTNEEALTRHVSNALATEAGSYRKDKRGSKNKIDLLVCSVLANGARNYILKKEARNTGSALILR